MGETTERAPSEDAPPARRPGRPRAQPAGPTVRVYGVIRRAGGYETVACEIPAHVLTQYVVQRRPEDTLPRATAWIGRELYRDRQRA